MVFEKFTYHKSDDYQPHQPYAEGVGKAGPTNSKGVNRQHQECQKRQDPHCQSVIVVARSDHD